MAWLSRRHTPLLVHAGESPIPCGAKRPQRSEGGDVIPLVAKDSAMQSRRDGSRRPDMACCGKA